MLITTLYVVISIYFRPFLPIDETRYISVAWEMWDKNSFFVPLINSELYTHKPPLLFWLIHLNWSIFGVNSISVRFIPLIFALGSIYLTQKIYKELWSDDLQGTNIVPYITAGSTIFALYSTLFMFDIMLSFWVLLALFGAIKAAKEPKLKNFAIVSIAIAFGFLAKGPAIIIPLVPIFIFAKYWGNVGLSFYIKGLLSFLIAIIFVILVWLLPAYLIAGKEYLLGVYWNQGAGRAVNSFAHKRAFWWYFIWFPALLFPWFLYSNFYKGLKSLLVQKADFGMRFLATWLVGTIFILSIISGKQLHYIIPEIFAFFILIARAISQSKLHKYSAKLIGLVFLILGVLFTLAPYFIKGYLVTYLDSKTFYISGVLLALFGIYFLIKSFSNQLELISKMAFGSLIIIFSVHFVAHKYFITQDFTKFSQVINSLQKSGLKVAHLGKYNDQFHFFGRLKNPIVIINSSKELNKFITNYPNGAIITYKKRNIEYNKAIVLSKAKLRTQNILLIKCKDYSKLEVKR